MTRVGEYCATVQYTSVFFDSTHHQGPRFSAENFLKFHSALRKNHLNTTLVNQFVFWANFQSLSTAKPHTDVQNDGLLNMYINSLHACTTTWLCQISKGEPVSGWPQTWKTWNTRIFLNTENSGNYVQPQGKIVTNKVFLVHHSIICVKQLLTG